MTAVRFGMFGLMVAVAKKSMKNQNYVTTESQRLAAYNYEQLLQYNPSYTTYYVTTYGTES